MSEAERLKTLQKIIDKYYKRIQDTMMNFPPHTQTNILLWKYLDTSLMYIHDITRTLHRDPLTLTDLIGALQELNLFISEIILSLLEDEKKWARKLEKGYMNLREP